MRRGIKSHIHTYRQSIDTVDTVYVTDKTRKDQDDFVTIALQPAHLLLAVGKDLTLGFSGHLLLKPVLFSSPLQPGNTEQPDTPGTSRRSPATFPHRRRKCF